MKALEKLEEMSKNEGRKGQEKAKSAYILQKSIHYAIHEITDELREKDTDMEYLRKEAARIVTAAKLISALTPTQVLLGLAFTRNTDIEIPGYVSIAKISNSRNAQ